jgi:hypothetical protein
MVRESQDGLSGYRIRKRVAKVIDNRKRCHNYRVTGRFAMITE